MKKHSFWLGIWTGAALLASVNALAESPASCTAQARYSIAVHGGYVGEARPDWPDAAVKELTRQIVARGRERLAHGASALDVVVESIVALRGFRASRCRQGLVREFRRLRRDRCIADAGIHRPQRRRGRDADG